MAHYLQKLIKEKKKIIFNLLKTLKGSAFFYYNNVFQAHAGKSPFYYQKMSIENDSEL